MSQPWETDDIPKFTKRAPQGALSGPVHMKSSTFRGRSLPDEIPDAAPPQGRQILLPPQSHGCAVGRLRRGLHDRTRSAGFLLSLPLRVPVNVDFLGFPMRSGILAKVFNFEQTHPFSICSHRWVGCQGLRRGFAVSPLGIPMGVAGEVFSGTTALMVLDLRTSRGDCRVGLSANRLIAIFEVPATVSVTFPRC